VGGSYPVYTFFYGNWIVNYTLGTGFFIHKGTTLTVERVGFVGDTMLYTTVKGSRCDVILNVHEPTEDKSDDMKDRFYEELEHHMKILQRDFNEKAEREDILNHFGERLCMKLVMIMRLE